MKVEEKEFNELSLRDMLVQILFSVVPVVWKT